LDISPEPGGGGDNGDCDKAASSLFLWFDGVNNEWWHDQSPSTRIAAGTIWGFSGHDVPDASTGTDENDALIRLTIEIENELTTSEKQALAIKYAPRLYFDAGEKHYPSSIEEILQHSVLKPGGGGADIPSPSITDLLNHNRYDSVIELKPTGKSDWEAASSHPLTIYSNVFTTMDGEIVVQYWFLYIYNGWPARSHEGDLEMIQLIIPQSNNPLSATPESVGYSVHNFGYKTTWAEASSAGLPNVYIAYGSHASYWWGGGTFFDSHWGDGISIPDTASYIHLFTADDDWLKFTGGMWGSGAGDGPVFRHSQPDYLDPARRTAYMWLNPLYWQSLWGGRP